MFVLALILGMNEAQFHIYAADVCKLRNGEDYKYFYGNCMALCMAQEDKCITEEQYESMEKLFLGILRDDQGVVNRYTRDLTLYRFHPASCGLIIGNRPLGTACEVLQSMVAVASQCGNEACIKQLVGMDKAQFEEYVVAFCITNDLNEDPTDDNTPAKACMDLCEKQEDKCISDDQYEKLKKMKFL